MILHYTKALPPCDVTRVGGIPVTTASRTLIAMGAVVRQPVVERGLEAALRSQQTSIWYLIDRLDELGRPGRDGVACIREVLRERDPRLAPTASELETMLSQVISGSALPEPERQVAVYDADGFIKRVDFAYVEQWVVIEAQGARWHLGRKKWLEDMERRNRLTLAGWTVIEVPWQDVVRRPDVVIERITSALRAVSPVFRDIRRTKRGGRLEGAEAAVAGRVIV